MACALEHGGGPNPRRIGAGAERHEDPKCLLYPLFSRAFSTLGGCFGCGQGLPQGQAAFFETTDRKVRTGPHYDEFSSRYLRNGGGSAYILPVSSNSEGVSRA